MEAAALAERGPDGPATIASRLVDRIVDTRNLRAAWNYAARDDRAPGPDGRRFSDFESFQVWPFLREIQVQLRTGIYRPGPERLALVPKGRGRPGKRPLVIQSIRDRVVQRAAMQILQPLIDPFFDARSFGFRPGRGRMDALAAARAIACREGRWTWVAEDLSNAFECVPHGKLLDAFELHLKSPRLRKLLEVLIAKDLKDPKIAKPKRGLRQGAALSPLLLNVYLDYILDQRWREKYPHIPLIRYADDILLLCLDKAEADRARSDLLKMVIPAGFALKGDATSAVKQLDLEATADWLGYEISRTAGDLIVTLGESSWDSLDESFEKAHEHADAPLRAAAIVESWIGQAGPCFTATAQADVCQRIREIGADHGFDELPPDSDLLKRMAAACDNWCRVREKMWAIDWDISRGSSKSGARQPTSTRTRDTPESQPCCH